MSDQTPSQPSQNPEILDPHAGTALADDGGRSRGGARKGLLLGGGVLGLALVGGGAWAAMSFFATGAQPAEALPADALGYVSIDLDPSGGQKIEAVRTLNKFPAFEDSVGISPEADLRKAIFDEALEDSECDVTYDQDIEPWLGDRAAIAAVPGDDTPEPVLALQVTDAGAAEEGLAALKECGGDTDDETGWVVEGDWAVVASSAAVAQAAVDSAGEANLADDADFQRWTAETGDPGIVTMYAAPGAGKAILDGGVLDDTAAGPEGAAAAEQLENFQGFAATLRFSDGSLELEGAGQAPEQAADLLGGADLGASVASLPDETAAVLGLSLGEGWFEKALENFPAELGDSADLVAQVEGATGLSLPEDIETLTAGGVVLAVGPGLDPEALANSTDPTQVPVALKLTGDADEIQAVVAKITGSVPGGEELVGTTADGDTVVIGPDEAFRDEVAGGGGLGESETFTGVVPDAASPGIFYLDVNAFDDAIESLAGGDQQVLDNVAPLRAIGASSSIDGDITRFTFTISTDD